MGTLEAPALPRRAPRSNNQAALTTIQIPRLGAPWPGEGGRFGGIVFDNAGKSAYCLILHDEDRENINWKDAVKWAQSLKADGHKDFALPDRRDGAVLFANNHVLKIEPAWHWLSPQYASDASYAWCQDFYYGDQDLNHEDNPLRARAVRRLVIS